MQRRTGWILAGLLLALLAAGGWLGYRASPAPSPGRDPPSVTSPAAAVQAMAPTPARPRMSAAATDFDADAVDPAQARCLPAWRQVVRERAARLATVPEADSQLAAALLEIDLPPRGGAAIEAANARRHRRLAWALELAPGDPLLASHAHRLCTRDDRCDASRSLALLVRSDPGNAWTWLAVLARAQAAGDEAGVERALERAADSGGARSYYGQTALRIVEPFGEPAPPPACDGYIRRMQAELGRPATPGDLIDIATDASALRALPQMRPLFSACPPDLRDRRRRMLCVRTLAHVASGETLLEQLGATSRLVQLTTGTPQGRGWRERYRNLQWLLAEANRRRAFQHVPPLELWARGEVRAMEEYLQARDAWPAPAGWLPDDSDVRALVLAGRRAPSR